MLDTQVYPSILASVLAHADRGALLALRGVSKDLRARADAHLASHLCMYIDDAPADRVCELVTAPHGRIPALFPRRESWVDGPSPAAQEQRARVLAAVARTRILDIVVASYSAAHREGAWADLLGAMDLDVLRQFPDAACSLEMAPRVRARVSVFFVVRPPPGLWARRWRETGSARPAHASLRAGEGCQKAVVHLLYNAGIMTRTTGDIMLSHPGETVFVLNPYGRWMPSYHRKVGGAIPPPLAKYWRSAEGRPRPRHQARAYSPGVLQRCIDGNLDGGCTVVNLASTPPSNLGFEAGSDPAAVELAIRDSVQARWGQYRCDSELPSNPSLQERQAEAVSRLTFLSGQEYADRLTAQEALDECFVAHVPGMSVRPRHLLPRPRRRPQPRPDARPPTPRPRHIPTSGPRPGTLDLASYPHIADALLAAAPREALLPLRAVCRLFRERADARFMRHLIIEENDDRSAHRLRGRISSPLGPVPALAHLHPGPRGASSAPPSGQIALPPAVVTRTKRLLALTRVLDFNPGYGDYPYFDDALAIALDVRTVRTFRAHHEPHIPFPARTLVVYHTPGGDQTFDDFHRPRTLVPDLCTKVVHHLFPTAHRTVGFDRLWTRKAPAVVVAFTPHHPALPAPCPYGQDTTSPAERRAYLADQIAQVLREDGTTVTLVNCHLVPHAWLGLPDDWEVAATLTAEVRGRVTDTVGRRLRCLSGEEYAAELGPDELEDEGTIEAVPGVRHCLLPHLQVAAEPPGDGRAPGVAGSDVPEAAGERAAQHLPFDLDDWGAEVALLFLNDEGSSDSDGEDMAHLFGDEIVTAGNDSWSLPDVAAFD
jgi:hypothetical protein